MSGEQTCDDSVGVEGELRDALEAFLEVRLDPQWILGLREDLQQLVIGQEEKPADRTRLLVVRIKNKPKLCVQVHKFKNIRKLVCARFLSVAIDCSGHLYQKRQQIQNHRENVSFCVCVCVCVSMCVIYGFYSGKMSLLQCSCCFIDSLPSFSGDPTWIHVGILPWEEESLLLQIVVQALLDVV